MIPDLEPAILARGLTRAWNDVRAVEALDLRVEAGSSFALLGPNGAGKSTTIGMLTTLVRPDGGSARVAGADVATQRHAVRSRIGIVFQDPTLDVHLTVAENLRFHAALFDMSRRATRNRVDDLLDRFDIADRRHTLVRTLSGGLRRRVELARCLMHEPQVLFLDEPTLGLDPRARADFATQLQGVQRDLGTSTVLTTHYLNEAEGCDRVAIMVAGRIVAEGTPSELRAAHGPGASLDDVYLAHTGRVDPQLVGRREQGREADRQRSGPPR